MKKSELVEKINAGIDHLMKSPAVAAREDILWDEVRVTLEERAEATSKRPWAATTRLNEGVGCLLYWQLVAVHRVMAAVHDTALVALVDDMRARWAATTDEVAETPRVEEPAKAEPASTPTSPGKRGGARKAAAVQAFLDALAPHAEAFGPALSKYVRDAVLDRHRDAEDLNPLRWQARYASRFLGDLTMGELHRARTHLIPAFVGLTRDEQYARMCASHALRHPHDPLAALPALPVGEEAAKAEATWTAPPAPYSYEAEERPGERADLLDHITRRIETIREAHNVSLEDATNALLDSYRMPWQRAHGTNLVGGLTIGELRRAGQLWKGQTAEQLSKNVYLAKAIARSREWSPEQRAPSDGIEKKEGWTAEATPEGGIKVTQHVPRTRADYDAMGVNSPTPEVERATAAAFQETHRENAQLRAKVERLEQSAVEQRATLMNIAGKVHALHYLLTRYMQGDTVPPALVQAALNA